MKRETLTHHLDELLGSRADRIIAQTVCSGRMRRDSRIVAGDASQALLDAAIARKSLMRYWFITAGSGVARMANCRFRKNRPVATGARYQPVRLSPAARRPCASSATTPNWRSGWGGLSKGVSASRTLVGLGGSISQRRAELVQRLAADPAHAAGDRG